MSTCSHAIIERHYDRPRAATANLEVHVVRSSLVAQRFLIGEGFYPYMFEDHILLLDETLVQGTHQVGPLCAASVSPVGLPPGVAAAEQRRFKRDFLQGMVIRAVGDPAGRLAAIARHQHLICEAELGGGGAVLAFDGPECVIRLPGRLPNTIAGAVVGRTVAEVLSHDALTDCRGDDQPSRAAGSVLQVVVHRRVFADRGACAGLHRREASAVLNATVNGEYCRRRNRAEGHLQHDGRDFGKIQC